MAGGVPLMALKLNGFHSETLSELRSTLPRRLKLLSNYSTLFQK
jgi:hypothetical protein